MGALEMFSKIEIDFEEIVLGDYRYSAEEYEIAFNAFLRTMEEVERQFFLLAKEEGFQGNQDDFQDKVLSLRI